MSFDHSMICLRVRIYSKGKYMSENYLPSTFHGLRSTHRLLQTAPPLRDPDLLTTARLYFILYISSLQWWVVSRPPLQQIGTFPNTFQVDSPPAYMYCTCVRYECAVLSASDRGVCCLPGGHHMTKTNNANYPPTVTVAADSSC